MNRAAASVPSTPLASSVIGSVEVLEHSSAPSLRNGMTSLKTFCFSSTFSKTASMTQSAPFASAGSIVGVIRLRISSAAS